MEPVGAYLDLLKRSLLDLVHEPNERIEAGLDWERSKMGRALTMIGMPRLDNIQWCLQRVIDDGVPGDVLEAGVWRGGACIFMKGMLDVQEETERRVILADSFQGLPVPDPEYPQDAGGYFHLLDILGMTSATEVRASFARFGLLDDRVILVEGWFKETLPEIDVERLALLRLDADMYESTLLALENLYFRVSPGGFVIIDDYPAIENCVRAVDDFRQIHGIRGPLQPVPGSITGVYWRVPF